MLKIQTILHATDFSAGSDQAFQMACALARDYGAQVIVVHVIDRSPPVYSGVMTAPPPPPPTEERKAAQEQMSRLSATVANVPLESRIAEGDPAASIVDVARACGADLIVMGTHGRTGLGRLLMGSVAEQVLRNAPCPVLTLKGTGAA